MNNRNLKLDNLKGILIYLVVLAHLLFSYVYYNSLNRLTIVYFIYVFHMPLFFIISGYLSNKEFSLKKIFNLLLIFCILNFSYILYDYIKYKNFDMYLIKYSSWYILILFIYRLILKSNIIRNFIKKYYKFVITISFVFSILIGFINVPYNCANIYRLIAFFPFFIFGYNLDLTKIKMSYHKGIRYSIIILFIIFILVKIFPFNLNFYMFDKYNYEFEFLFRIIYFCLNIVLFISLYNIVSNKQIKFITQFGQYSLYIYVFHRIITLLITDTFILTMLYIPIVIISSFLICYTFSRKEIIIIIKRVLNYLYKVFTSKIFLYLFIIFLIIVSIYFTNQNKSNKLTYNDEIKIENSITLGFVGDLILLENQVKDSYENGNYDFNYMFNYSKKYFQNVDYMIGVLEGPVDDTQPYSVGNFDDGKKLHLNYPSTFIDSIKNSGIDLVTTSNNHLLDRGIEGVKETINNLQSKKLDYIGSYNNKKIINVEGLKIGILSYTYGINYHSEEELLNKYSDLTGYLCSSNSKNYKSVKKKVDNDFKYLKDQQVDLIVVLPHMGTQFINEEDKYQKFWNNIFVQNGADIVLGNHSHSVQPIRYQKDTLIINSVGNYVNSYIGHNGDVSMMIKVYIDKKTKKVVTSSIIGLLAVKDEKKGFYSLPVYDGYSNQEFKIKYYNKLNRANKLITRIVLDQELELNKVKEEYFYFPNDKYKSADKYTFLITEKDKKTQMYKNINDSESLCFIGDSITEGTKNELHPWFEPLTNIFKNKKIYNFSKGSFTTINILNEFSDDILNSNCDLYFINIGTNDIRYNLLPEKEYEKNITKLINLIDKESKIVLLSPFRTTDKDVNLQNSMNEKKKLYDKYDAKLIEISKNNKNIIYHNVNNYIIEAFEKNGEDTYLLDGVHPNKELGIKLYSYALFRK